MNRDADRYQRVKAIFIEVCALPADRRAEHLDRVCVGDSGAEDRELRSEVEELLARDAAPADQLRSVTDALTLTPPPKIDFSAPERVAEFEIGRQIGEGGMGVVFEARQTSPRRTVALKVVRRDLIGGRQRRRFEFEADILAQLEHPGIARIYATGTDGEGRPYFAMELIDGSDLLTFANDRELDLHARLRLFLEICDAVHHAHQRGVIHRDLKPNNILVTHDGRPKILDFGVARSIGGDVQPVTVHTMAGQIVGTIPYMSPEQALGDSTQLDVRSDVYALGVVLYELLTGRLPYDFPATGIPEALEVVRNSEPLRASRFRSELRGDLETILAKALDKQKDRRYGSARELAQDLERFLGDQPIVARPASALYQLRKFTRRHRLLVSSVGVILITLVVSLIAVAFALDREKSARQLTEKSLKEVVEAEALARTRLEAELFARDTAESQIALSRTVSEFLLYDVLSATRPDFGRNRDVPLHTLLDIASESATERLADQPLVESWVRSTLARCYLSLSRFEQGRAELDRALELAVPHLGLHHPDLIVMLSNLSLIESRAGNFEKSQRLMARALPLAIYHYSEWDGRTRTIVNNWASVLSNMGDSEGALAIHEYLLSTADRTTSTKQSIVTTRINRIDLLIGAGRAEEALAILPAALEEATNEFGADHPLTLTLQRERAIALRALDQHAEALEVADASWDDHLRVLGDASVEVQRLRTLLGGLHRKLGNYDRSAEVLEAARGHLEAHRGLDEITRLRATLELARAEDARGNEERAVQLFAEVVDQRTERFGPHDDRTLSALRSYADQLEDVGELERSLAQSRKLLTGYATRHEPREDRFVGTEQRVARLLRKLDRTDEALAAVEAPLERGGLTAEATDALLEERALIEQARREYTAAARTYQELREVRTQLYGADHVRTHRAAARRGLALRRGREYEEAIAAFREVITLREPHGTHDGVRQDCLEGLFAALRSLDRFAEAQPVGEELLALARTREPLDVDYLAQRLDRLSINLRDLDRPAERVARLEERLRLLRDHYGDDSPKILEAWYDFGVAHLTADDWAAAVAVFEEALPRHVAHFGLDDRKTAYVQRRLSIGYRKLQRFEEAEALGLAAHATILRELGPEHRNTRRARDTLHRLYVAWEKPDEAAKWE